MKKCKICGLKDTNKLVTLSNIENKEITLCTKHFLEYSLGKREVVFDKKEKVICAICNKPAYLYKDGELEIHLCYHHYESLITRKLDYESFKFLQKINNNYSLLQNYNY